MAPGAPAPQPSSAPVDRTNLAISAVVLAALALPTLLTFKTATFRDAGVGAFVSLFFGILSLFGANARFLLIRSKPRALALSALAAGLGATAILVAAIAAHSMHGESELVRGSDVVYEPGMREYLAGAAQSRGRTIALFGLVGIPGFLIGTLNLALVLGARRIAETEARRKLQPFEPTRPVWFAISAASAVFLIGFVLDVWAVFRPVDDRPNPRAEKLQAILDAADGGRWHEACEQLDVVLARGYVPEPLLDEKLPARVELAHRCIGRSIDDLPSGKACETAADKLLMTDTVRVARAKDRVRKACKGR